MHAGQPAPCQSQKKASDASAVAPDQIQKNLRRGYPTNKMEIELNTRVVVKGHVHGTRLARSGVLRYYGPTHLRSGQWAGVELDEPTGKNSGTLDGIVYFRCKERHGVFVHPTRIESVAAEHLHSPGDVSDKRSAVQRLEERIAELVSSYQCELNAAREEAGQRQLHLQTELEREKKQRSESEEKRMALEMLLEDTEKENQLLSSFYKEKCSQIEDICRETASLNTQLTNQSDSLQTLKMELEIAKREKAELSTRLEQAEERHEQICDGLQEGNVVLQQRLTALEEKSSSLTAHNARLSAGIHAEKGECQRLTLMLEKKTPHTALELGERLERLQSQYKELNEAYERQRKYFEEALKSRNHTPSKEKHKRQKASFYVSAKQKELIKCLSSQLALLGAELERLRHERSVPAGDIPAKIKYILDSNILSGSSTIEETVRKEFLALEREIEETVFSSNRKPAKRTQSKEFSFPITPSTLRTSD
eukprot:GHVN01033968.1.p2 GENE.GHVN01033968.1~~GHVN01033968.1.p2  ORF type:complete len:480 (-),score=71.32 GHVN01033968.1:3019-4458(-)